MFFFENWFDLFICEGKNGAFFLFEKIEQQKMNELTNFISLFVKEHHSKDFLKYRLYTLLQVER